MTSPGDDSSLRLAISLLRDAGPILDSIPGNDRTPLDWIGREPKAAADEILNDFFLARLRKTGVPILSEEAGHDVDWRNAGPVWILDPLDGTLNFVRGTGPCAISLSLWQGQGPQFGVVLDVISRDLYWGGRDMGSWCGDRRLAVSVIQAPDSAVLCTGIPASFDFKDKDGVSRWVGMMEAFGKVRMIGSAASSLVLVAKGAADFYFERNVKIWDVAAGIALVEGAGGQVRIASREGEMAVSVAASNAVLDVPSIDIEFF